MNKKTPALVLLLLLLFIFPALVSAQDGGTGGDGTAGTEGDGTGGTAGHSAEYWGSCDEDREIYKEMHVGYYLAPVYQTEYETTGGGVGSDGTGGGGTGASAGTLVGYAWASRGGGEFYTYYPVECRRKGDYPTSRMLPNGTVFTVPAYPETLSVGKHCWRTEGYVESEAPIIREGEEGETIEQTEGMFYLHFPKSAPIDPEDSGDPNPDYEAEYITVPYNSTLSIINIGSFNRHCVDSHDSRDIIPLRVIVDNELVAHNSYERLANESCDGGTVLVGTETSFDAFTFSEARIYDVRVQMPERNNGTKWKDLKHLRIKIADVRGTIEPPPESNLGVFEGETGTREVLWTVKNTGYDALVIAAVEAVNCEPGIFDCSFPTFNYASGLTVEPGEEAYIAEQITAAMPQTSPEERTFTIDVNVTDEWALTKTTTSATTVTVNRHFEFSVEGRVLAPAGKSGTLHLEAGTYPATYYAQVCTDSREEEGSQDRIVYSLAIDYDPLPQGQSGSATVSVADFRRENCNRAAGNFPGHLDSTAEFIIYKPQDVSWTIAGISGIGEENYVSDWAVVGRNLDAESGFVGGFVFEGTLGKQEYYTATSGPHRASVNRDEGTKVIDTYTLQPNPPLGEGETAGTTKYRLYDVKFFADETMTGTSHVVAGPATSASDGKTRVMIDPATGTVAASTSYSEAGESQFEFAKIFLMWLAREKFLVKVSAGQVGVCYGAGDVTGFSGSTAAPRVNYNWTWSGISENFCDKGNENYVYCDAAQFTIELLERLEKVRALAAEGAHGSMQGYLHFEAYLMHDGYTADFMKDFDDYMLNYNFADTPTAYVQYWSKYVENPDSLVFEIPETGGSVLPSPGLYQIDISLDFPRGQEYLFFTGDGTPNAKITVRMVKVRTAKHLLYSLPFDGSLGINPATGRLEREGYGTGFVGAEVPITLSGVSGENGLVETAPSDLSAGPLVTLQVEENSGFDYVHREKRGAVLSITKAGIGIYKLTYSPSYASPVIMFAESSGSFAGAFYKLLDGTGIVEGREGFMNYWTGIGESIIDEKECLGYDGEMMFYSRKDRSATAGQSCSLYGEYPANSFGLGWATELQGRLYAEAIFFTPPKSSISLVNACTSAGRFLSEAGYANAGGGSLILKSHGSKLVSVQGMVESIRDGDLCATAGEDFLDIWWNSAKLQSDFRSYFYSQHSEVTPCDPAGAVE